MCGVFALYLNRPLTDADIALGRAGVTALKHRGPDSVGEWYDVERGVFLGHRRLTIIDLSDASNQPMVHGGLVISYNGEIYNYRDLRSTLKERGTRFETSGDTEVLLKAWQEMGSGSLDAIDGMFAFTIWDGMGGWLAVDPFGEKQLYYAEIPDGIIVSSEIGVLADLIDAKPDLSDERLVAFMALGYIPAPHTAFSNIKRLVPAEFLKVVEGRIASSGKYWSAPVGEPGRGTVQPLSERDLDRLQEVLVDTVDSRLVSDVPLCIFLSSGIDSALVASMAKRDLNRDLQCLTVSFPQGRTHDEAAGAAKIAAELQLPHETIVSEDDPGAIDAAYMNQLFGQPNDNLTVASVYQMATAARTRGFRVALSGVGGDEVFFGYNKHFYCYSKRHWFGLPESLRLGLRPLAIALQQLHPRIGIFRDIFAVRNCERFLAVKNMPTFPALKTIPGLSQWARNTFTGNGAQLEYEVPRFDLRDTLANHHLPCVDVGSMRASLELRTPYLSRRLQEVVATSDPRAFLAFGQKSVLRRLLSRYLPSSLIDRPKMGFVFPFDRFLNQVQDGYPRVGGLPESLCQSIWDQRAETGWQRLAIRLVLAQQFKLQPSTCRHGDEVALAAVQSQRDVPA
tara:strand:- start:326 stop:2194 length:1869 start_codon:yes stop_codon:yes gene_type:complete